MYSFSGSSDGKESAYNVGEPDLIPGSGISPEEESGNPLQYSCLENSIDRGVWQATVLWVSKSWTELNEYTCTHTGYKFAFSDPVLLLKPKSVDVENKKLS